MHLFDVVNRLLRTALPEVKSAASTGQKRQDDAENGGTFLLLKPKHVTELCREHQQGNGPKRSMSGEEIELAHIPSILNEM